jgi:hypothetical protein
MTRKVLPLVAALALACFNVAARAQYTAYGMVTVEQLSGIQSSPLLNTLSPLPCPSGTAQTPTSNCTAYNESVHPIGFTGGVARDIRSIGPAMISVDLRGIVESDKRGAPTLSNGPGIRIYSGLGGIRASFHTPFRWLTAYGQGSVGYGRSNYGVLTNAQTTTTTLPGISTQGNLEYHAFAGTEIRITPLIDFRFFEFGYGALQSLGTYSHSYPLYSLSSGIVFHIPPRDAQ